VNLAYIYGQKLAALDPMHSALRIGLRHGAMGAGAGALIGGAAGAARAEDGHRWQGAARGAAIGGAIGGTVAGVGSGLMQRGYNKDLTKAHADATATHHGIFDNLVEGLDGSAADIAGGRATGLKYLDKATNAVPRRWTDGLRAAIR
jgi:hypothetical protein